MFNDECRRIERERAELVRDLAEAFRDTRGNDDLLVDEEQALLVELTRAREEIDAAQARLRRLIAYGREFHGRRPYPLNWLAEASGMSISGVRTAYSRADVERVAEALEIPAPPAVERPAARTAAKERRHR